MGTLYPTRLFSFFTHLYRRTCYPRAQEKVCRMLLCFFLWRCGLSLVSSAGATQSTHTSSTCQSRNLVPISSCVALRHGSTVFNFLPGSLISCASSYVALQSIKSHVFDCISFRKRSKAEVVVSQQGGESSNRKRCHLTVC